MYIISKVLIRTCEYITLDVKVGRLFPRDLFLPFSKDLYTTSVYTYLVLVHMTYMYVI